MSEHKILKAELEVNNKKMLVFETEGKDKGIISYVAPNGKTLMSIQKKMGFKTWQKAGNQISSDCYEKILKSKVDVLGKKVLAHKDDPSYEKVIDLLPPFRGWRPAYTFLGEKESLYRPLPQVEWNGSIAGCLGFGLNGKPVLETSNIKQSLLDGYLPVIQFVYQNETDKMGFEEIACAKSYELCGNSAMLVFVRLKIKNFKESSRKGSFSVFFTPFTQADKAKFPVLDFFYPTYTDSSIKEEPEWLWVSEENDWQKGKVYPFGILDKTCHFRKNEEKIFYLILAYPNYLKRGTLEKIVPEINFYRALFETKNGWDSFLDNRLKVETPEVRVNNACKATLIQSFMTVVGSDVKYAAAGMYADQKHLDGLLIPIINAVECFSEWGYLKETERYLTYFLKHYIDENGNTTYKNGTGLYDYGLLLYAISRYYYLGNKDNTWLKQNITAIRNICDYILKQREKSLRINPPDSHLHGLISSSLCDDLNSLGKEWYNYANDACCWLGLREIGKIFVEMGTQQSMAKILKEGRRLLNISEKYKKDIISSLKKSINYDSRPSFIPMYPGNNKPFPTFATNDDLTTYCNYGFYNHLLYADLFDAEIASAIVEFRKKRGGEILGTSRFMATRLDDWPLAEFGWSMINLDKVREFLLTYYGDLAHFRMENIFTAYEQVDITHYGDKNAIGHNICSTLVTPRLTKYMLVFEERDAELLWLNRAIPRRWLQDGEKIIVRNAPTRWCEISYSVESHTGRGYITSTIDLSSCSRPFSINIRFRHPDKKKIMAAKVNGSDWQEIDIRNELIKIPAKEKKIEVKAIYC